MQGNAGEGLALLVRAAWGRKLVMGGRVDEEVEAVGMCLGRAPHWRGSIRTGNQPVQPIGGLQAA